jgi:hypothetical protein
MRPTKTKTGETSSNDSVNSCEVAVVPRLAPRIAAMAGAVPKMPLSAKPTTVIVVALDECQAAVISADRRKAGKGR